VFGLCCAWMRQGRAVRVVVGTIRLRIVVVSSRVWFDLPPCAVLARDIIVCHGLAYAPPSTRFPHSAKTVADDLMQTQLA